MKFLLDAQLPVCLARRLAAAGHGRPLHTTDLLEGNRTADADICARADEDGRVVVTKDRDFRDRHLLAVEAEAAADRGYGNITNTDLLQLFDKHLDAIVQALDEATFVELADDRIVIHADRSAER